MSYCATSTGHDSKQMARSSGHMEISTAGAVEVIHLEVYVHMSVEIIHLQVKTSSLQNILMNRLHTFSTIETYLNCPTHHLTAQGFPSYFCLRFQVDRPPRRRGSSGEWRHDRLSRLRFVSFFLLGSPSKKRNIGICDVLGGVGIGQDDVLLIRSFQGRDLC